VVSVSVDEVAVRVALPAKVTPAPAPDPVTSNVWVGEELMEKPHAVILLAEEKVPVPVVVIKPLKTFASPGSAPCLKV
jgi:hypothetical protein